MPLKKDIKNEMSSAREWLTPQKLRKKVSNSAIVDEHANRAQKQVVSLETEG